MNLTDIHLHALYGTDDGPKTEQEMFQLVDAIYQQGTRVVCVTPHFHPGYFGDNRKKQIMHLLCCPNMQGNSIKTCGFTAGMNSGTAMTVFHGWQMEPAAH